MKLDRLATKIRGLLFDDRSLVECFRQEIITEQEVVNVVTAHVETWLEDEHTIVYDPEDADSVLAGLRELMRAWEGTDQYMADLKRAIEGSRRSTADLSGLAAREAQGRDDG